MWRREDPGRPAQLLKTGSPPLHPFDTAGRPTRSRLPITLPSMMEETGNRYLEEQLQANLAAAVRVLSAAQRSLETHDAALANVVLGFEADARAGMRPVPAAV